MQLTDFKGNIKEGTDMVNLNGHEYELTCTIVEFTDKIIMNMSKDGEMDISYDLHIPSFSDLKKPTRRYDVEDFETEDLENQDNNENGVLNTTIVPTVLIGGRNGMKTQVVASQIGQLMSLMSTKNVILNISGKLFGLDGEEYQNTDFATLQTVVGLVRTTMSGIDGDILD